jgi:hypothetical protein
VLQADHVQVQAVQGRQVLVSSKFEPCSSNPLCSSCSLSGLLAKLGEDSLRFAQLGVGIPCIPVENRGLITVTCCRLVDRGFCPNRLRVISNPPSGMSLEALA